MTFNGAGRRAIPWSHSTPASAAARAHTPGVAAAVLLLAACTDDAATRAAAPGTSAPASSAPAATVAFRVADASAAQASAAVLRARLDAMGFAPGEPAVAGGTVTFGVSRCRTTRSAPR